MKAKGYLTDSYKTTLDIEGFDYIVDRSVEKGGTNTGTTPHGMLIGSIAACKVIVAKSYLDHNKIPYERVDVTAESEIQGKKRNETIDITVHIQVSGASLDEKEIGFMTRIVEKGCTMANILTAGGENKVTTIIQSI